MATVSTGSLRERAELQAKVLTPDGSGGNTIAWVTERELWCHIRPFNGAQMVEAMRQKSTVTHEIMARYRDDITTAKRILHRGTAYNIAAVWNPEEKRDFVHIAAESGVAT
jgi:SPP1 family predicted phage head-tail adaptor